MRWMEITGKEDLACREWLDDIKECQKDIQLH